MPRSRRISVSEYCEKVFTSSIPRWGIDLRPKKVEACELLLEGILVEAAEGWLQSLHRFLPQLVAVHYRGIQTLSQKKSVVAVPAAREKEQPGWWLPKQEAGLADLIKNSIIQSKGTLSASALHELLLRCYEVIQNHNRYTLNALLADRIGKNPEVEMELFSSVMTANEPLELDDLKLTLNREVSAFLLGGNCIADLTIGAFSDGSRKNCTSAWTSISQKSTELREFVGRLFGNTTTGEEFDGWRRDKAKKHLDAVSTAVGKLSRTERLRRTAEEMKNRRRHAVWSVMSYASESECPGLRDLCASLWGAFCAGEDPGTPDHVRVEAMVRLLQGVCAYHMYGNHILALSYSLPNVRVGSLTANVTMVLDSPLSPTTTNRVLGPQSKIRTDLYTLLSAIAAAVADTKASAFHDDNGQDSTGLDLVLQDDELRISVQDSIAHTMIDPSVLAASLRLAEVFRPEAVHEGRPLELILCLGTPYHMERYFEVQTRLHTVTELIALPHPRIGDQAWLEWLPLRWEVAWRHKRTDSPPDPGDSGALTTRKEDISKVSSQITDHLYVCRARIKGNAGTLMGGGRVLFVNYLEQRPAIGHVVLPAAHPATGRRPVLRDLTDFDSDMCFVRVVGRDRVEFIHRGKVVACWVDAKSGWGRPPQWTASGLSDFLRENFGSAGDFKDGFDALGESILLLSDKPGVGAAFVISTSSFKEFQGYTADMTDYIGDTDRRKTTMADYSQDEFIEGVSQDGGTMINLSAGAVQPLERLEIHFRQQFLPWHKNCPFHYRTARIDPDVHTSQLVAALWSEEGGQLAWREWYDVLHWGTRHLSTLGMSACLRGQDGRPDVVTICVSQDGPIHVFQRGVAIDPRNFFEKNMYRQSWRDATKELS